MTAARTARRSSTDPPNQCGSHRTLIAAAPPASYARARATMSSSAAAISPADGERRLISAMTWRPGRGEAVAGSAAGRASRPRSPGGRRGSGAPSPRGCRRGGARRSRRRRCASARRPGGGASSCSGGSRRSRTVMPAPGFGLLGSGRRCALRRRRAARPAAARAAPCPAPRRSSAPPARSRPRASRPRRRRAAPRPH